MCRATASASFFFAPVFPTFFLFRTIFFLVAAAAAAAVVAGYFLVCFAQSDLERFPRFRRVLLVSLPLRFQTITQEIVFMFVL